jgi:hypothetical protein
MRNRATMETTTPTRRPRKPRAVTQPARPEPQLGDNHPLNDILGTHEGPDWEALLKNIKRNRKKLDRLVLDGELEA